MVSTTATGVRQKVTPEEALRAGRRRFLRTSRCDIATLATELGVGRATLHRWFGARENLLGEVLWSLCGYVLGEALSEQRERGRSGPEAVADAMEVLMDEVVGLAPLRRLLDDRPQVALRVLTSHDGLVQPRLVAAVVAAIDEFSPESVTPGLSADDLAYAIVRLSESSCYADVIAGRPVDVARASVLHRRLLGAA
jgi:AcrR family transcriptional regulator